MFTLGPIGFTAPWLLAGLAALPLLWWLLRAVPPAPIRRIFPGVSLLLGLEDRDTETARTPLWLMLLRMAVIAAMIAGFAGPVLNPAPRAPGQGPLVVLIDDGWAASPDWQARLEAATRALKAAEAAGRPAALIAASAPPRPGPLALLSAGEAASRLAGIAPQPWLPDHAAALSWAESLDTRFETLWLSDGLDSPDRPALARALSARGPLRVLEPPTPRLGLRPAQIEGGLMQLVALRSRGEAAQEITVTGLGPDPSGTERELIRATLRFAPGATRAEAGLSLPPELRNRLSRFRIEGSPSAGAVSLADDGLRRRKVALIAARAARETLDLLSPRHYLREALAPSAEVIEGPLTDMLAAGPDVVILADVASLPAPDAEALTAWVAEGGLLLRFAGPELAAAEPLRGEDDPLLPVPLRAGGRSVGGAMSWGAPQALAPFPEQSPFYGLAVPDDVTISSQVLAEPGPDLAARTIAALADGTPLVTRKGLGDGQVVLVHTSANAEWSSLALSGLFVQMLDRLALSSGMGTPERGTLAGTIWLPDQLLDGFGALHPAGERPGLQGEALTGTPGPALRPGLYRAESRRVAVNALGTGATLNPARWPAGITPDWQGKSTERDLSGWVLLAALALLAADILAALTLSGRLSRGAGKAATLGLGAVVLAAALPDAAQAAGPIAELAYSTIPAAVATGLILALLTLALRYARTSPKAGPRPPLPPGGYREPASRACPGWMLLATALKSKPISALPGSGAAFLILGLLGAIRFRFSPGCARPWGGVQKDLIETLCPKAPRPDEPLQEAPCTLPGGGSGAARACSPCPGKPHLRSTFPAPLGGRVRKQVTILLSCALLFSPAARAQDISPATRAAAGNATLAYVRTGDEQVDRISAAGLAGLSTQIRQRSSVEPSPPAGVDLEADELSVFPLLYWPVTADQPLPSPAAYAKLNAYLHTGGMILFDTRDGDLTASGASATPEAARLRALAQLLDIPPLEPVPGDHVLTRAFYLLDSFPGRYQGGPVWVEAAPADATRAEGMPFRNLNDGVTPVVIGGADWAAAWAVDAAGAPMFPVGRGYAGERQREIAYRFGVNLVMHVLTGNYKSDQVHVPALLERLGE